MDVVDLRAEHVPHAIGLGTATPRLSWCLADGRAQSAYEVRVEREDGRIESSGWTRSPESVLVPWPVAPLASRESARVRVRVRGPGATGAEPVSGWSAPLPVEAGLLRAEDWTAVLVRPGTDPGVGGPAVRVRGDFEVDGPVHRARLYSTAEGVFAAELNGERVGDELFPPGWTSYRHRRRYLTHDVTALLVPGPNVLGATLADGWHRGRIGFDGGRRNAYGSELGFAAQLEIRYADGRRATIATDGAWRSAESEIRATNVYDGEVVDARLREPRWCRAGFDATRWPRVRTSPLDARSLVAPMGPPVRRTETLRPVASERRSATRVRLDFGQNLVGRLRLRACGPAGSSVVLRHAEVLEHGELGLRPLRLAKATDTLVLDGSAIAWEPEFAYHGFRFAEIDVSDPDVVVEDVVAIVVHSDLERTGEFACSDARLERLHENVRWSMRGNVVDVPTDCPQRDERLGWTGDIGVFAPAATGLYDCAGFLASWMEDLLADQHADGVVPLVVPDILTEDFPAAVWADAVVDVPWTLHERYGDVEVLRRALPGMRAWVDWVDRRTGPRRVWDADAQLGDWLDPSAPPDRPGDGRTSGDVVATAYFARSAARLGAACRIVGGADAARHYEELARAVRAAFRREYVTAAGRVVSDSQTAYALAIVFDLLEPGEERERAGRRLVELVQDGGHRIGTGFVGTAIIADALTRVDAVEVAYRMLAETACPSFLYPVTMGATTTWERWDSMLPDGSINPGEMTSFNHCALGAIADWMHRTLAGVAPDAPGYRRIRFAPRPGGGITAAGYRVRTPYGPAWCRWTREGARVRASMGVPAGTTGVLDVPGERERELAPGEHEVRFRVAERPAVPPVRVPPIVSIDDRRARG